MNGFFFVVGLLYSYAVNSIDAELLNVVATVIIVFLLLLIYLSHLKLYTQEICSREFPITTDYDYTSTNGPHTWKNSYPSAVGHFQSPVNICTKSTTILSISEPLTWNNYEEWPTKVFMENTGHTVRIIAEYKDNVPYLSGADLVEHYSFVSASFRWSGLDHDGSEHSVNDRKYPMEMQVVHDSIDSHHDFGSDCTTDLGILILSYFFTITKYDNPYMHPIISNLQLIRKPFTCVEIPPLPLSWLCYPYKSGFYSYGGSLTEPPCTEGITWFVQPEPFIISERQMKKFVQLTSTCGSKILRNVRPLQELNERVVCYNRYDN